jgi:uncharacterized protein with FMN-binding domain
MRRAVLILAGTAAGLVLLLSFKAAPLHAPGGLPPASVTPAAPAPRARASGRAITGPAARTLFGAVQVRVSLTRGRITGIQALQLPHDFALSQQISSYAGPLLRQEALRAQSAHIDVISGATYTSEGYRQSLQAALDAAGG